MPIGMLLPALMGGGGIAGLGSLGSSLIGGKQIGAAAPAFNPQGGGLLDTNLTMPDTTSPAFQPQNFTVQSLEDLIGPPESRGRELSPQVRANDLGGDGPVMTEGGVPESFREGSTPETPEEGGFLNGFGNFLGGIDKGLQSPSHVLGLGLLGQMGDQRLPLAGLLAMGLLNRNKQ